MKTAVFVCLIFFAMSLNSELALSQFVWDPEGVALRKGLHTNWIGTSVVNEVGEICIA